MSVSISPTIGLHNVHGNVVIRRDQCRVTGAHILKIEFNGQDVDSHHFGEIVMFSDKPLGLRVDDSALPVVSPAYDSVDEEVESRR